MINIHRLNEEIEKILEEETEEIINGLKLIPHGENSVKYYTKAVEYFMNHVEEVKSGFINLPLTSIGISDNECQTLGYEFK